MQRGQLDVAHAHPGRDDEQRQEEARAPRRATASTHSSACSGKSAICADEADRERRQDDRRSGSAGGRGRSPTAATSTQAKNASTTARPLKPKRDEAGDDERDATRRRRRSSTRRGSSRDRCDSRSTAASARSPVGPRRLSSKLARRPPAPDVVGERLERLPLLRHLQPCRPARRLAVADDHDGDMRVERLDRGDRARRVGERVGRVDDDDVRLVPLDEVDRLRRGASSPRPRTRCASAGSARGAGTGRRSVPSSTRVASVAARRTSRTRPSPRGAATSGGRSGRAAHASRWPTTMPSALALAGTELDDVARAAAGRPSPRPEVGHDPAARPGRRRRRRRRSGSA